MKSNLVFVHGLFGSEMEWDELRESFKDYDVVCLTLPGHGINPIKKRIYSVSELARWVFEQVSVLGPSHFIGYSLGGRILLKLFKNHPSIFKSLTLESSSPGLKSEAEKQARRFHDQGWQHDLKTLAPKAFFLKWYDQELFGNLKRHSQFGAIIDQRILNFNSELAQVLVDSSPATDESMWPILKTIPNALIVAGEEDKKYVGLSQSVVAEALNFKLEIVSNAGHAIHLERPQDFAKAVKSHLDCIQGEK